VRKLPRKSGLTCGCVFGRWICPAACSIGDEIDEDELEAELEGLEEEWAEEEATGQEAEAAPSYLAPAQQHDLPAAPSGTLDSGRAAHATDEFGLPVASYST
jgi:charged multivesicular body protein 5